MFTVEGLFLIHFFATCFMTGLIWFVQIVHYPLFLQIPRENFSDYEVAHQWRTTIVVLPLMGVELLTGVLLYLSGDGGLYFSLSFYLLLAVWASTFLIQVPLHRKLEGGYSEEVVKRLVSTNWFRTVLWSVRVGLLVTII